MGAGRACDAKWNSSVFLALKRNDGTLKETGSIAQINVQCLKAAKNILYTHVGAGRSWVAHLCRNHSFP